MRCTQKKRINVTVFIATFMLLTIFPLFEVTRCEPSNEVSPNTTASTEKLESTTKIQETEKNTAIKPVDNNLSPSPGNSKKPLSQSEGLEPLKNSDSEIAKLDEKCIGETKKIVFVFQNRKYINKRSQDIAQRTWDCNAFLSGNESSCSFNDEIAGKETEGFIEIEETCKQNFTYLTYLMKAAQNHETCLESATKFCTNTDFCAESEGCSCEMIAKLFCEFSKVNTPDDCQKLADEASRYLKDKEQKEFVINFCENLVTGYKGNYSATPKNDKKFINAIFLLGVFGGKTWPLYSASIDLEKLYIEPEFLWYYDVYLNKRKCEDQLENSWTGICKEYSIRRNQ